MFDYLSSIISTSILAPSLKQLWNSRYSVGSIFLYQNSSKILTLYPPHKLASGGKFFRAVLDTVHASDLCHFIIGFQFFSVFSVPFIWAMIQCNRFCVCLSRSARYVQSFLVKIRSLYWAEWLCSKLALCIQSQIPMGRVSCGGSKSGM